MAVGVAWMVELVVVGCKIDDGKSGEAEKREQILTNNACLILAVVSLARYTNPNRCLLE